MQLLTKGVGGETARRAVKKERGGGESGGGGGVRERVERNKISWEEKDDLIGQEKLETKLGTE